ncbi:MAG TPA: GFA family protein [Rhizomicrobium sp.]|nr:GFA family protein [Rhizomicrobium sp.]
MNQEGGCSCGAVRYALTAAPMFTNCCHCLDCQKQTGGAFAINALVEAAQVKLLKGAPVRVTMPTESGRPHDIWRCPECQVALWSDYGRRGYLLFLRVSTLDAPHAIAPDAHIFARSKVPWVDLSGPLPNGSATGKPALVCDVYYDMKTEWPPASMARRDAASAAAKG